MPSEPSRTYCVSGAINLCVCDAELKLISRCWDNKCEIWSSVSEGIHVLKQADKSGHWCCSISPLAETKCFCYPDGWCCLHLKSSSLIRSGDMRTWPKKTQFLWRTKFKHCYSARGGLLCSSLWCEELDLPQTFLTQLSSVSWCLWNFEHRVVFEFSFFLEEWMCSV